MNIKNKSLYEKIINIALDMLIFLFGIILLVSIYNTIQVKLMGKDYADFFGFSTFEVQTGSMANEINIGDWIIVKKSQKFELNDVVTYKLNSDFITHRIIETYKGTYVTQGDANNTKDNPISEDQIIGKVVKVLPHFGIFRKTLFNPGVLITLIITLYLIGYMFKTNKPSTKKGNLKNDIIVKVDALIETLFKKIKTLLINIKKERKTTSNKTIPKIKETTKEIEIPKETIKEKVLPKIKNEKVIKEEVKKVEDTAVAVQSVNIAPDDDYDLDKIKEEVMREDDLDKTMYFRSIQVDKSEIDNTYLKIAENQINEKQIKKAISKKVEKEVLDDDSLIKNNLEMFQNKNKKCKNIINKIILINKEKINSIIEIINNREKLQVNEATIRDYLIDVYIDARYYKHCGNVSIEYNTRNMVSKIDEVLIEEASKLSSKYKGNDNKYEDKTRKYASILSLIVSLEQANELVDEIPLKREVYKKKITKYFIAEYSNPQIIKSIIDEIIKTQKIYDNMIDYSLKKLETNTFELILNALNSNKKMYGVELKHNIAFSKVYSEYIVDKTYTEGIIAEDKIIVLVNLLLTKLVKNMMAGDFKAKYILYVPATLYTKEKKLNKLLKLFDDEYAKDSMIILIRYNDLVNNKKVIRNMKKEGYKLALVLEKSVQIKAKDEAIISVVDHIFIDKKAIDVNTITPFIPEGNIGSIISEDIISKIGIFGGE